LVLFGGWSIKKDNAQALWLNIVFLGFVYLVTLEQVHQGDNDDDEKEYESFHGFILSYVPSCFTLYSTTKSISYAYVRKMVLKYNSNEFLC
jgi:hypothetical protein